MQLQVNHPPHKEKASKSKLRQRFKKKAQLHFYVKHMKRLGHLQLTL